MFDNNALIARAQRAYYALGKEMQGRCKGVASSKQALSRLMSKLRVCLEAAWSMARVWLEYGWSMARVWLEYGYTLLTGGRSLCEAPSFSPSLRTTSPLPTDCEFAPYGLQILRYVTILILMMVVGVNGVKAQDPDYSGTYYIASVGYDNNPANTDNYYLCPTEGWAFYVSEGTPYCSVQGDDNGQPFLTTYQIKKNNYDVTKAKWTLTKVDNSNYYYIQQTSTKKYIVTNGAVNKNLDRARVHLETINDPNDLDEKAQFAIYPYNGHMVIKTSINEKSSDVPSGSTHYGTHDDHKWFTVNQGNKDVLSGTNAKTDGPSSFPNTGGIVGIYTENDTNSPFYLEDIIARPTIGYDASGNIKITNNAASATIYYTTDGTDPITSETKVTGTNETTLTEFTDGDIIKAVAKFSDDYSNVATFTAVVHVGSSNQYLIQNLECTDFYMIPGDVSGENTTVNTSSLFRPTMSWYFSDAGSSDGIQYYYIINGSTGDYLYFTSNNVYMKTSSDFDESDSYKFAIVQGFDADSNPDGFHIVPKAQISDNTYSIYKGGWSSTTPIANASADAMKGSTNGRQPVHIHTRWKFVLPNTLDKTPPFTVTDASTHITKFYKIASVGSSGYYIVPPTGNNTNATTSNSGDAAVIKSGTWFFEKAKEYTDVDWCTYYYIRNAETGKYLYFTKDASGENIYTSDPKACLEMRETKSGDEDPYLFTWARTATAADVFSYYIVPKKLKDVSLSKISTLQRIGNTLQSNITREAGNYAWTFDEVELFCNNPVFEESGDNIVISCIPGLAEIHYTTNGDDPSADGATYSVYPPTTPFSKSDQHLIKACAVINDGATPTPNTASSAVITLFNKPDIALSQESYTYDGSEKIPSITKVSIGEIVVPSSEYTSEGISPTYANNTNAETETVKPTVTLTDVADNNLIIANASRTFEILPLEATLDWGDTDFPYSGSEQAPMPAITNLIGEDVCTVTVSVEGEHINAGDYTATAVSLSNTNYQLPTDATLLTKTFTIIPKPLGDGVTPSTGITVNLTKSGDDFIITVKQGENLLNTTDHYNVTGPEEEDGVKTWTITGKGNYSNSVQVMYKLLTFWKTGETAAEMQEVAPFITELTDMESPSGMVPYIVSGINMTKHVLKLKSVSYIPKDEPVLLLSATLSSAAETEADFTSSPKNVENAEDTSNNLLKISEGQHVETGQVYAFYKGRFALTSSGTLKVGKFYLDNPNYQATSSGGSTDAAPLRIVLEDMTGIDIMLSDEYVDTQNIWYSVDGRRLNGKPAKKGLYINNGRKVVIK